MAASMLPPRLSLRVLRCPPRGSFSPWGGPAAKPLPPRVSLRWLRMVASFFVLLVLALHSVKIHAELVFRSQEQVNGQTQWSGIKKYSNPADFASVKRSPGRAVVAVDEVRVFLTGEITRQDLDSATVMAGLLKSGQQKIAGNTLWLSSHGGDIDVGMDLARLLRKLGLSTFVDKNDRCASACVFAFMGGERRSVAGQIGIHRPYFPFTQDSPDRPARFRHLQKTLRDFVEEMDFPASLYEAVMLVPPESMQIVSVVDLKRFYLEGISPLSEDKLDAAEARRLDISMAEYLKRKPKTPV